MEHFRAADENNDMILSYGELRQLLRNWPPLARKFELPLVGIDMSREPPMAYQDILDANRANWNPVDVKTWLAMKGLESQLDNNLNLATQLIMNYFNQNTPEAT